MASSPSFLFPAVASTMLGTSVDMSADGSVVVAGAPQRANQAGVETGIVEVWACGLPL